MNKLHFNDLISILDEWRLELEGKGLRISRDKTEYICVEYVFGGRNQDGDETMRQMIIGGDVIREVKSFKINRIICTEGWRLGH